jgi:glycosidase
VYLPSFADTDGDGWVSHFGGPAWTLSETTGQYYLHLFRPEQPDLNWRNPAVAAEIDGVLEHWIGHGLDGSPAVYDTNDPTVIPSRPRGGTVRLAS